MRVVVIGPAPPLRGGIAQHTAGMAAALRERGHRVGVLSYRRLYPRALFPGRSERAAHVSPRSPASATLDEGDNGRREICVSGSHVSGGGAHWAAAELLDTLAPRTWLHARAALSRARPDLVVVQWWHPIAAPALVCVVGAVPCAVAVVCHNAMPHEAFPCARALVSRVLARSRLAVCHSAAVARAIGRIAPGTACVHVPMPVLIPAPAAADLCEREHGTRRPLRVVFAGLVRPYKGIDVLLEAWRRARLPTGATLTIAGESYLGAGTLAGMVSACGEDARPIRIIDEYLADDALWALLRSAAVVVLPYRRASQSGVLPMAVAAGAAVVASDAGGLAETIVGDARHRIVPAGDASALARALESVLAQQAEAGPDGCARARDGAGVEVADAARHAGVVAGAETGTSFRPALRAAVWSGDDRRAPRTHVTDDWAALAAALERSAGVSKMRR
jgi:glycosyltransferase involved in cell wall biosynthesis